MRSLKKKRILAMKVLLLSVQLLVSLLLLLFNKIYHRHLLHFNDLLVKAVISGNQYKFRGRKISEQLTREDGETKQPFRESMKSLQKNVRTLTRTGQIYLCRSGNQKKRAHLIKVNEHV